ncbi:MAG: cupredoxin domain-containing protein [Ktedonobacterales bacterium]
MNDLAHLTRGWGIRWWPGIVLFAILLLAGCGTTSTTGGTSATTAPAATTAPTTASTTAPSATTASTGTAEVKITEQSGQYGFAPTMMTVAKGTKVTWTNASDAPHTVTSDAGSTLASSTISPSTGTFSFTFTQPGTYTYHCTIHPYMKGTIVVTG